ncbi:hypothetical protein BpHYR1_030644 [Brachionus plicatilis]|uniref:Uncharacterized protein n=1 Tax=Brachionus plicatilis TaxID=10195 RepID=A0A3M7Q9M4_BRAPC|nr:hypothetical protein BpHYR1_030644 [Brachionus plicatilis]
MTTNELRSTLVVEFQESGIDYILISDDKSFPRLHKKFSQLHYISVNRFSQKGRMKNKSSLINDSCCMYKNIIKQQYI